MREMLCRDSDLPMMNAVRGTMDAGINNVIYMEHYSGPKMTNGTCGKTIVTGIIERGSTVCVCIK
jgi:hypothetical protein